MINPDQAKQIKDCRALLHLGETPDGLRKAGYAERAIQIAGGRDPYGANNGPVTTRG